MPIADVPLKNVRLALPEEICTSTMVKNPVRASPGDGINKLYPERIKIATRTIFASVGCRIL